MKTPSCGNHLCPDNDAPCPFLDPCLFLCPVLFLYLCLYPSPYGGNIVIKVMVQFVYNSLSTTEECGFSTSLLLRFSTTKHIELIFTDNMYAHKQKLRFYMSKH